MTAFEKVSLEFVKFMRGQYKLDEVAGMYYDIPCLRFRQGKKTIVSVNLHKDYYDIQELPKHIFEEMMHFFEVYKTLEHKKTTVKDILHRDDAMDIINKCLAQYKIIFPAE